MKYLIIFDLDGTLLNTIDDLGAACNVALAHFGFPVHAAEDYPSLVGNGVNKLIERALPEEARTQENIMRLRRVFVEYYDHHNRILTKPYEGIAEVLAALKQRGWLLAVASNKYQTAAEDIVEHYFPQVFDVILGERDGCPRKPDPQIVFDIMKRLSVQKAETKSWETENAANLCSSVREEKDFTANLCISKEKDLPVSEKTENSARVFYVGDSDVDILTARNAGLPVIACTWGFCTEATLNTHHPDFLIHHPSQLLGIL